HFVIRWSSLYPDADSLSAKSREFPPLPQHILGPLYAQIASDGPAALTTAPYWGQQYVGLGPYRLVQWDPGAFIEATAFDGYALGAPKIPRIRLRFSGDQNVVVASMLSGDAQLAADNSISQAGADTLRAQW